MNAGYLMGLIIGGLFGFYLLNHLFRYAILGNGGTKVQHLWVIMFTCVVLIGFSAFGDGTDGFLSRIKNPANMDQAIPLAIAALILSCVVWLSPDKNQPQVKSPMRKVSILGRTTALIFIIPMSFLGLGNVVGSTYNIAVHGPPSPGLGVNPAQMREIMLNGDMASFWQLIDQKSPADLTYISNVFLPMNRISKVQKMF